MKRNYKKIVALFTVFCLLVITLPINAFANEVEDEKQASKSEAFVARSKPPANPEEYRVWKENLVTQYEAQTKSNSSNKNTYSVNNNMLYNQYIEAYISSNDGKFTFGTTGGNPNSTADDYKMLTFLHPGSTTSETLIRIDGVDSYFYADSITFNDAGTQCIATGRIGDIHIQQIISIEKNPYTQREDIFSIKYVLRNNSTTAKQIGSRIMLDTMLGDNDGAPFRIPGIGEVTTEREFSGNQIPQYWQAFDSLNDPKVIATGTFYRDELEKPDKVQFAYWGNIRYSSFGYQTSNEFSLTNDSAVATYFNPRTVMPGQSRSIVTYYGIGDFSATDLTPPLSMSVTAPQSLYETATGYSNNPFVVTAYIQNIGLETATNVKAIISLPEELEVEDSDRTTIDLGNMPLNREITAKWMVRALPQATEKVLNYKVKVLADNSNEKAINLSLTLLPVSNLHRVVTFNLNGASGMPPTSRRLLIGDKVTKPTDPIREGYRFIGWYANSSCEGQPFFDLFESESIERVTNDITLYASWKKIPELSEDDHYSFKNSSSVFTSSDKNNYGISDEYFNILIEGLSDNEKQRLRQARDMKWGGSCLGMGISMALIKDGILDVDFFDDGANSIKDLTSPNEAPSNKGKVTESLINFYQLAQFLPVYQTERAADRRKEPVDLHKELVNAVKNNRWTMISATRILNGNNHGGHLLIGYKVEEEANGYKILLLESNAKQNDSYLLISKNYVNATLYAPSWGRDNKGQNTWNEISTANNTLRISSVIEDESIYDSKNIQNELIKKNRGGIGRWSILSSEEACDYIQLTTNYHKFTIVDDRGNIATVDGMNINGNLDISLPVSYISPESDLVKNEYFLNTEGTYTITPLDDLSEYNTSIIYNKNNDCFSTVTSSNKASITFNPSGEISAVSNTVGVKTLLSTINSATTPWYTVSAEGNLKDLTIIPEDDNNIISSTESLGNIKIVASNDKNDIPVQLNTSEKSLVIKDSSDISTGRVPSSGNSKFLIVENQIGNVLESVPVTYSVSYRTYGGTPVDTVSGIAKDTGISKPSTNPTRPGYIFAGWYKEPECLDGQEWNFETDKLTQDITLHAKWIQDANYRHNIIFRAEGFDDIIVTVLDGERIDKIPKVPSKIGYLGQWDVNNFNNIRNDMIVNAVYTQSDSALTMLLNPNYVVLQKTQTKQLVAYSNIDTIDFPNIVWSTSNANVATVNETGRVTAVGTGTAIIKANCSAFNYSAECKVVVFEDEPSTHYVKGILETTKATVNIADNRGIDMYYKLKFNNMTQRQIQNFTSNLVEEIILCDPLKSKNVLSVADAFVVTMVDDKTFNIKMSDIVKNNSAKYIKKSYSAQVLLKLKDGSVHSIGIAQLNAVNEQPKVTMTLTKGSGIDLFSGAGAVFTPTTNVSHIKKIEIDPVKTVIDPKKGQIPDKSNPTPEYFRYDNETDTIYLQDLYKNRSEAGKYPVRILATVDGFNTKVPVLLSLSITHNVPKLKLSTSNFTMYTNSTPSNIILQSADAKIDIDSLGITNVHVANVDEMTVKEQTTYKNQSKFTSSYDVENKTIKISNTVEFAKTSVLLAVSFRNYDAVVKLPITITPTYAYPIFKLQNRLTLNALLPNALEFQELVISNSFNLNITPKDFDFVQVINKENVPLTNSNAQFTVYDQDDGKWYIKIKDSATPLKGNYTIVANHKNYKDSKGNAISLTIPVSVLNDVKTAPTLSATAKGKIDTTLPESIVTLSLKFTNANVRPANMNDFALSNSNFKIVSYDRETNSLNIRMNSNTQDVLKNNLKQTTSVIYTYHDGITSITTPVNKPVVIPMGTTTAKVITTTPSINLLKADKNDESNIALSLIGPIGAEIEKVEILQTTKAPTPFSIRLVSEANGIYAVGFLETTDPTLLKNQAITINVFIRGSVKPVTVKINIALL